MEGLNQANHICDGCVKQKGCIDLMQMTNDLNGLVSLFVRANGKGKKISAKVGFIVHQCKNMSKVAMPKVIIPTNLN